MSIDPDTGFSPLISCVDAQVWAREFVKIAREQPGMPLDEHSVMVWFANAIETARDVQRAESCQHPEWVVDDHKGTISGLPRAMVRAFAGRCASCGVAA